VLFCRALVLAVFLGSPSAQDSAPHLEEHEDHA
jgi:hypothetical protein